MRSLHKKSSCKINLLLNILTRREDGFHELETVMLPVPWHDHLTFELGGSGIRLECSDARLPVDDSNLVVRAARRFGERSGVSEGVAIRLEKRIPMAAGLGGGSGNAAATLAALNQMHGRPMADEDLQSLASELGSDVPFFLQDRPALATGRGEKVESLEPFAALGGASLLLIHPGFGISTAWAYRSLARYPDALHGRPGRAEEVVAALRGWDLAAAGQACYNSLEAPALDKYPWLGMAKSFFSQAGAPIVLMSGSGSTVFAIFEEPEQAESARAGAIEMFGGCWTAVVRL